MTALDLDAIKARCEAATSGPWYQGDDSIRYERSGEAFTRSNPLESESYDVWPSAAYPEDAAFVAHARDDVPALVAEVERLTARLAEIEGVHIEGCWRKCGKFPCSCGCHASKIRYGSTDDLVTSAVVTNADNDDSARHTGSTVTRSSDKERTQ